MRFVWDEQKNRLNIRKHNWNFARAEEVFNSPLVVDQDDRFDYDEDRRIAIGRLHTEIVVVIYTQPDDETVRIISMRKALRYEREIYESTYGY